MRKGISCIIVFVILLSITSPGAVGQENQYSRQDLPPLLNFLSGKKVEIMRDWENRKDEIHSLLIRYFVGTFPEETPKIADSEITSEEKLSDGSRRQRIKIILSTTNKASFEMELWIPHGDGPFPLLLTAPKDYQLLWAEDALKRGYAVCLFPGVDSHHQENNYPGYESVWESFRNEYPNATWTEISTKGWLASRCIDYLTSSQSVIKIKPKQISIIGFSRYGKQAMIAAAFDKRIACVVARSPGSPASSPYRLTSRNTFAETPSDFPSEWFLPSLKQYNGSEDKLPIDAHGWYALIAPRHCLIHTAHNDGAEPTFAVEKAFVEGRAVYEFLGHKQKLHLDYRTGGHSSVGKDKISFEDRKRNLDWIDHAFERGDPGSSDFKEELLHDFNWNVWRSNQNEDDLILSDDAPVKEKIKWILGEKPLSITKSDQLEFLTKEESELMTHDRWKPGDVKRVPINFGSHVKGNLYFNENQADPMPVVIWLHPYSYHSGYNEGYGVQGTTVYNRLAQNGFAVIAYDQCGFGLRLLEGTTFYDKYPRWSRLGRMVEDAQAAVQFAIYGKGSSQNTIPKLDPDRVFLLGYSVGSLVAMYTAALDENISGFACFSGWSPMRTSDNSDLWNLHALAPRLGIYHGREGDIPIDYKDILKMASQKPCLIVTPKRDRFADYFQINKSMKGLVESNKLVTWRFPDEINSFQASQQNIFVDWAKSIIHSSSE